MSCARRQIVRVFMPERGLSWHLPLYLKGSGKSFLSLISGCLEDAWKHTFASAMSRRGVCMVGRVGPCHAHKNATHGRVVAVSNKVNIWLFRDSYVMCTDVPRRHLATSSGVYLTFPSIHLSRTFVPVNTDWFSLSISHRSILTLTPPRNDSLQEAGAVLSFGYTLRAPGSEGYVCPYSILSTLCPCLVLSRF